MWSERNLHYCIWGGQPCLLLSSRTNITDISVSRADECVGECSVLVDTLSSQQRTLLGLLYSSQHAVGGSGGMTWNISTNNICPPGQGSNCSLLGFCSCTLPPSQGGGPWCRGERWLIWGLISPPVKIILQYVCTDCSEGGKRQTSAAAWRPS